MATNTWIARGTGLVVTRPATAGTNFASLMSLFNGSGSGVILRVYRVILTNNQIAGVAAQGIMNLQRINARTVVLVCTTAASTTITCAAPVSFFGGSASVYGSCIKIGQTVTGTGAASGARVTAVASATSLTVSQTGSVSAGTSLTFASDATITPTNFDSGASALPAQVVCEKDAPVVFTGTSTTLSCTTAASTTLTTAGSFFTSGVVVGSYVFGTNIATGTVVTAMASATSLTLSIAGLGAATNTLTFIAPDIYRRLMWSTKAPIVNTATIDTLQVSPYWGSLFDSGHGDANTEPIVLREGEGLALTNPISSAAPATGGVLDCQIEFTST